MFVPWKYGAYLPTLSFSCSSAVLLLIDQETRVAGQCWLYGAMTLVRLVKPVALAILLALVLALPVVSAPWEGFPGLWCLKDELLLLSPSIVAWGNQDEDKYVLFGKSYCCCWCWCLKRERFCWLWKNARKRKVWLELRIQVLDVHASVRPAKFGSTDLN